MCTKFQACTRFSGGKRTCEAALVKRRARSRAINRAAAAATAASAASAAAAATAEAAAASCGSGDDNGSDVATGAALPSLQSEWARSAQSSPPAFTLHGILRPFLRRATSSQSRSPASSLPSPPPPQAPQQPAPQPAPQCCFAPPPPPPPLFSSLDELDPLLLAGSENL
jgi:hypothetical protein